MTKSFKCTDVGTPCEWSATANSDDELMQKIIQHALEHHDKADIPVEKVKAAIKEE